MSESTTSNVVRFPSRDVAAEQIREKLGKPRLDKELLPRLAENLGRMACKLEPDDPAKGAHRMFDHAFGPSSNQWHQRKRWLRLSDDERSDSRHAKDYTAGGTGYVQLAEAFAEISGRMSGRERMQVIFDLVRGTKLDPRGVLPPNQVGIDLARETLARIAANLSARGDVRRAFDYLGRYPIAPWTEEGLGEAPDPDHLRSPVMSGAFSFVATNQPTFTHQYSADDPPWCVPRCSLGYIYVPVQIARFDLGPTAELLRLANAGTSKSAQTKSATDEPSQEDLNEIYWDALARAFESAPSMSEAREFVEKNRTTMYFRCGVYLGLLPRADGGAEATLFFCQREDSDEQGRSIFNNWRSQYVVEMGGTPSEDVLLPDSWGEYWHEDEQFDVGDIRGRTWAVEGSQRWSDLDPSTPTLSQRTSEDEILDILMIGSGDEYDFHPAVWDDPTRFAQAPQTSLAATIIRNVAYAPLEERIETKLAADISRRFDPLLRFFEQELSLLEAALDGRTREQ